MVPLYKKEYGKQHRKVIFLLAGWGNTIASFSLFSYILSLFGFHCITYAYDPSILSPDIEETIRNIYQVKDEIEKRLKSLAQMKDSFCVFGTSLGTVIALLLARNNKSITKVILNLTGATIGDSIWGWGERLFPEFHRSFKKQQLTLFDLRKKWKKVNPSSNLVNLRKKSILLYVSKHDDIIPYSQAKQLMKQMKKKKLHVRIVTNNHLNHFWSGFINLLFFHRYIHFLLFE